MFPRHQVTFVANIVNRGNGATNVTFSMEDGTGGIDVRMWLESGEADEPGGKMEGIE